LSSLNFENDLGEQDPELLLLLQDNSAESIMEFSKKLLSSRLITALVPQQDEIVEIRQAIFENSSGKKALLVFTSLELLNHWDKKARPLAKSCVDISKVALSEELDGFIIDIDSAHRRVIQGSFLTNLANNLIWVPPFLDEEMIKAVALVLAKFPRMLQYRLEKSASADFAIVFSSTEDIADEVILVAKELSLNTVIREKAPQGADLMVETVF
jgi:hypothetical protein